MVEKRAGVTAGEEDFELSAENEVSDSSGEPRGFEPVNSENAGNEGNERNEGAEGDDSSDKRHDTETPGKASLEEKVLTLEAKLNEAQNKAKEYYEHLQRLQAEFDNYRKRTQKEKEETIKYAAERVIAALLPVLDNFDRAMAASQNNQDFAGFMQGIELIFRQMQTVLAKEGLKAIEALGKPFDPNLHEAVLQVDSEEHPENTVVEELQKGYYLKERVLRPSMVKVSR